MKFISGSVYEGNWEAGCIQVLFLTHTPPPPLLSFLRPSLLNSGIPETSIWVLSFTLHPDLLH